MMKWSAFLQQKLKVGRGTCESQPRGRLGMRLWILEKIIFSNVEAHVKNCNGTTWYNSRQQSHGSVLYHVYPSSQPSNPTRTLSWRLRLFFLLGRFGCHLSQCQKHERLRDSLYLFVIDPPKCHHDADIFHLLFQIRNTWLLPWKQKMALDISEHLIHIIIIIVDLWWSDLNPRWNKCTPLRPCRLDS